MRGKYYQRILTTLLWMLAGVITCGALLDTVSNSISLLSVRTGVWCTVIAICLWTAIELRVRSRPLEWTTADNRLVHISRLGPKLRYGVIGFLIVLWIPMAANRIGIKPETQPDEQLSIIRKKLEAELALKTMQVKEKDEQVRNLLGLVAITQPPSPYAKELARSIPDNADEYSLSLRAIALGRYEEAKTHLRPLMNGSRTKLARLYYTYGDAEFFGTNFQEAIRWYKQAQVLTPDDPDMLHGLGLACANLGRFGEARRYFEQALAQKNKQYGTESPSTALSMGYLGQAMLIDHGDITKAEHLVSQALKILEQRVGVHHPLYAEITFILSYVRFTQGNYVDGEKLLVQATNVFREIAPEDYRTAISCRTLAYYYLSKSSDATQSVGPLIDTALRIDRKNLGEDNGVTATDYQIMGSLQLSQGKYRDAEMNLLRGLNTLDKKLGKHDLGGARAANSLGLVYIACGRYADAEPYLVRAYITFETKLPSMRSSVATLANNLATARLKLGNYAGARKMYNRSLALIEQELGNEHAELATPLCNLAKLYRLSGELRLAEKTCRRSLSIAERHLGSENPETAFALNNLADILLELHQYDRAAVACRRALAIREVNLGRDHKDTASSLDTMARIYLERHLNDQAQNMADRALKIRELRLPPEHIDIAQSLGTQALIYQARHQRQSAEHAIGRALQIATKSLGSKHPETIRLRKIQLQTTS